MNIECVISLRDESGTYHINAYLTLLSVFENTSSNIRLHVIHDETVCHFREKLQNLCDKYGHEAIFHKVPEMEAQLKNTLSQWFNLGTCYRLYMHELINAEKVLYIDTDIIAERDISELYSVPLNGRLVAAARDISSYWNKRGKVKSSCRSKIEFLKLREERMFNAGVIVLNLDKCRELSADGNIFIKRIKEAVRAGLILSYPDQEILNSVAQELDDSIVWMDESFNYMLFKRGRMYEGPQALKGKIVHFAGGDGKPSDIITPAHLLYWKYYARSPWGADVFEQLDNVFQRGASMRFFKYYIFNPKRRRLAADFMRNGLLGVLSRHFKTNKMR